MTHVNYSLVKLNDKLTVLDVAIRGQYELIEGSSHIPSTIEICRKVHGDGSRPRGKTILKACFYQKSVKMNSLFAF